MPHESRGGGIVVWCSAHVPVVHTTFLTIGDDLQLENPVQLRVHHCCTSILLVPGTSMYQMSIIEDTGTTLHHTLPYTSKDHRGLPYSDDCQLTV